jgi:uncharacterized membrane protein
MIDGWRDATTLATAMGCGLVGGAFFAFSAFVMPALGSLPAPGGISAMQAINVYAPRPALGLALLVPAVGSAALIVSAIVDRGEGRPGLVVCGGLLYLVGCLSVTMGLNVPLNDALASVDPSSAAGAAVWRDYLTDWTRWNSLRSASGLAASALLVLATR